MDLQKFGKGVEMQAVFGVMGALDEGGLSARDGDKRKK